MLTGQLPTYVVSDHLHKNLTRFVATHAFKPQGRRRESYTIIQKTSLNTNPAGEFDLGVSPTHLDGEINTADQNQTLYQNTKNGRQVGARQKLIWRYTVGFA